MVTTEAELPITDFEKRGSDLKFHFEKTVEENTTIKIPLYNYGLHRAYISGTEVETSMGEYGLINMNIPGEITEGDVEIRYVGRNIYKLGDATTVVFICGILGYYWMKNKKQKMKLVFENK